MIGFIGGTGAEGRGLALRYAALGYEIAIGSRDYHKATRVADELSALTNCKTISGMGNHSVAKISEVVFLTVPYSSQSFLLEQIGDELASKIVVNTICPLEFKGGKVRGLPVEEGSAAEQSQALIPKSKIVSAYHNISASDLLAYDRVMNGDVVVCSDHQDAKRTVMTMIDEVKDLRSIDGGSLDNSRYLENLTALLLNINRIHKTHTSIKIVGL